MSRNPLLALACILLLACFAAAGREIRTDDPALPGGRLRYIFIVARAE